MRCGGGDGDVATAGDGSGGVLEATGFIANGNEARVGGHGGSEEFPGAIGGAAVDEDHLGGWRRLGEKACDYAGNVLSLVQNGDDDTDRLNGADGLHGCKYIEAGAAEKCAVHVQRWAGFW